MTSSSRPRAPRTTPAQRRDWLERWQRSGLSLADFARKHSLAIQSLRRWRSLSVPATALDSAISQPAVFHSLALPKVIEPGSVELRLPNGIGVRCPAGTPVEWLAHLCASLR
jgi:hypothetical protein